MNDKCPVCGGFATTEEYWGDGNGILEESYTSCGSCSYVVDYSYGRSSVTVGTQSWLWYWNDPEWEKTIIKEQISVAIGEAQKVAA